MAERDLLDTALDLAAWGYAVFPAAVTPDPERPGKHRKQPLIRAWQTAASTDEAAIEVMPWARATHVAVACGKSRICVLDFDDASQKKHLPPLELTVRQTTISGGEHYWFAAPQQFHQGNTTHSPRPGVDIRGDGGFVIWYGLGEWADFRTELAPWPFQRPFHSGTGEDRDAPLEPDVEGAYVPRQVREGGRNQDLIRAAGWWMRSNPLLEPEWLVTALLGHTQRWHTPPLDALEVRRVAESARRWHHVEPDLGGWVSLADLPPADPPEYLLGQWLVQGSVNLIFSRAGVGKTGVMVRLLASLLSGRGVLGWEAHGGPYRRRVGWVNGELPPYQFEVQVAGVLKPWEKQVLTLDTRRQNLLDRGPWLLRLAEEVGILVLDTRSSLFRLADVNASESWERLNDLLRELADLGVAVFLATHAGKPAPGMPSSAFGSSAQEWFVESSLSLTRPTEYEWAKDKGPWADIRDLGARRGAAFQITCEKNRNGPPFANVLGWWSTGPQGNRILQWQTPQEE